MSKETEDWFQQQLKKVPLNIRIETMLSLELELLKIDNPIEKAEKWTKYILEEIDKYNQDKFDLDMEKVRKKFPIIPEYVIETEEKNEDK
jgi:phenolic acid decarboxylase